MEYIHIISEQEVLGKQFRVYGTIENPLFLAKDVAAWIDYSESNTSKLVNTVDEGEKVRNIITTLGGNQEMWFLTEDGLYETLMQSRKPIAKEFKKKVKEILKAIRKHGMYAADELLDNPDLLIKVATELKLEREKRRQLETEIQARNQIIGELKPKADYMDQILNNKGLVTITQIAKDYGMSGKKMNGLLHKLGIQYKQSEQWLLYAKYHNLGYTHSKTIDITRSDGMPDVMMQTKWTQKGRLFLYGLLKRNGHLPVIEQQKMA